MDRAWEWEVVSDDGDDAWSTSAGSPRRCPAGVDKWLTLRRDDDHVRVRLEPHKPRGPPVRFVWNQHIAHAIGVGSRVHLPVSRLSVAGPTPSHAGDLAQVSWPQHTGLDFGRLPDQQIGATEFLCADDVAAGWYAVPHPEQGLAGRISFDPAVFRTPWL